MKFARTQIYDKKFRVAKTYPKHFIPWSKKIKKYLFSFLFRYFLVENLFQKN